jgi:hypothetical protein
MWKLDWTHYVSEQIKWAEILITKADDIPGYESAKLRDRGSEILSRVSRMIGEELTDDEDYGALLERLLANGHDITRFRIEARLSH